MNAFVRRILGISLLMAAAAPALAQEACPAACQTYRLEYKTVCEEHQATAYRIELETVYDQHQVTSYKPVWETTVRENRYTVARPVTETALHEEVYTVQRPVYETAERDESYTVLKPVYETAYRTECRTVYQPVTTCQTQYVDRGCFVDQVVLKPSVLSTRLTWQSASCAVDPLTGQTVYQRPGLYWTQAPVGRYEVQKVWHPNVVPQQVQQTSYVPQTVTQQIPVQVCKYLPEQVVRKVPVQMCRMVTEQQVRKVPVTTCKTVYEEHVDPVQYQVCRMVAQQETISVPRVVERQIPLTYTYSVPRVVCYRVPLDACGNPIVASPAPACETPGAVLSSPAVKQEPTPAKRSSAADVPPRLENGVAPPRPIEDERPPMKERPMKVVPSTKDSTPKPSAPDRST